MLGSDGQPILFQVTQIKPVW